ncbi:nucleotidyltransferase family protein [Tateyamaria pelophila]|uniref:nucleotidyltransferase family protein n=1 Tax=Tateyamaria pelophila TaxID=328415 RepID=UPI0021D8657A|nr:nucleotidyltransferase family protein [Tateyamaria pelophila]
MNALPPQVQAPLRQQAIAETMWDLRHRQILVPLLRDLHGAGIKTVLLKGTALAYSVYGSPAERPRGDTDMLVHESQVPAARAILARHRFRRTSERDAERAPQEEWRLEQKDGGTHCIDMHWNLLSGWALSSLFDTGSIIKGAVDLPLLGTVARMPAPETALLHACVHRAQHFSGAYFVGTEVTYAGDRLIWFVDMDLLSRRLTPEQWQAVLSDATRTGTTGIAHEALQECQRRLGTPVPQQILTRLKAVDGDTLAERYLIRASFLKRLWTNIRSLPAGGSRIAFLCEIFLPAEKVMRQAYPELADKSLARLHLHRYRERVQRLRKERKQRPKSS